MPRQKANIDRVFHALGDPTRRAIVERLSEGTDLGVAPGDTFEDHCGCGRATPADIGEERAGAYYESREECVLAGLNRRVFRLRSVDRRTADDVGEAVRPIGRFACGAGEE